MVVWVSWNMTVSVISSTRRVGGKPVARRIVGELVDEVSWASWAADRLTVSESPSPMPDPPRRGLAARLEQHRAAEGEDGAALLGQRDELVGLDEAAGRVVPARERLDAERRGPSRGTDGLVEHVDLAHVDRVRELGRHRVASDDRRVHRGIEHREPVLAGLLGRVHRHVRVAQQVVGLVAVLEARGDADAGRRPSGPAR